MSLNQEDIIKSLEELILQDKKKIIKWLDEIKKPENQKDGKIPSLFLMKIDSELYSLILNWLKDNKDEFSGYDFTGIPESTYVSTSKLISKYELVNWIPIEYLKKYEISKNPNAVDYLKENREIIRWNYLSANPNAIELLRKKAEEEDKIGFANIFSIPDYKKLDWGNLSANPGAVELLKKYDNNIKWDNLSKNTNPYAIKLLKDKADKEDKIDKKELEELTENEKIDWGSLSLNPNAIEILKTYHKNINWQYLSKNPAAIELIKDKIDEEKSMTTPKPLYLFKEKYIDWNILSYNPNAIEILKANPTKIQWRNLSANPNAIELIKNRIEEESKMNKSIFDNLTKDEKIDWDILSANPNAIEILKKHPKKINWNHLSTNPNAIEILKKNNHNIVWKYLIEENPNIFEMKKVKITKFETIEDVQRWCNEPEIHPITSIKMPATSRKYYDIYETAYNIMKNEGSFSEEYIINLFPKNHLLFGNMDLLYYTCIKKNNKPIYNKLHKNNDKGLILYELLVSARGGNVIDHNTILENYTDAKSILDIEKNLIKNRFSSYFIGYNYSNFEVINEIIVDYIKDITNSFLETDYITNYDYPERIKQIKLTNLKGYVFIDFLENSKMATGNTVIEYLTLLKSKSNRGDESDESDDGESDESDESDDDYEWVSEALYMYNNVFKKEIKDIEECFNPNSGIIENIEDKKLILIDDPLDKFFQVYEKKLEAIKNPIYSQLIDLSTFKLKENVKYLNNEQYKAFKKVRDKYDEAWKKYSENRELYENTRNGSSPKPPEKPKITLPWGKEHTIAKEIDPIHIKDNVVAKFREEYEKVRDIIDEYNSAKNMSYKELKKHLDDSPSSSEKKLIEGNKLLSMTREDFVKNILYDYSDLSDKCSEKIDILTNEELDDENYPLSKLQLMVRLKVYSRNKQNYRTECIYAPKLYNYLIKCINAKEPFINPVTKAKYTQENIEELMKVIRILDPKIEVPVFIKHRNDTKLKINHNTEVVNLQDIGSEASFGTVRTLKFNSVYISRVIAGEEMLIYNICYIPDDIEATGTFATGSTDLTSSTMLYRIYKLFNEGRLLYNYIPPYKIKIPDSENEYTYIKPDIHFNRISSIDNWLRKSNRDRTLLTKNEFIERFKHYAQEINNYTF